MLVKLTGIIFNLKGNNKMTKEQVKTKVKPLRDKRIPFGIARSKLDVDNLDPAYHYRWVNDEPGRIAKAQEGGYSFVIPEEVNRESNDENRVNILGGSNKDGSKLNIYLMKIPMELHLEDVELMQGQVDKIDEAIQGGNINREANDGRYVPKGGISYNPS